MGILVDGQWHDVWYDTDSTGGKFERSVAQFRHWVTADGSAGPSGDAGFKAEAGRYHLYVSYACPWAQRTLIYRSLKGLENMIDVSVVHWLMAENGWTFAADEDNIVKDHLYNSDYYYQLYLKADPNYSGRATVPILWDKQKQTIVSNESSEIIRMFNTAFDNIGATPGDYYPRALQSKIDELNQKIYSNINNGVYKAGFATSQTAYEEACTHLFAALEELDLDLANKPFLLGEQPTEADWRLFPTLLRFDLIYFIHFKCSKKRIQDYPNLWKYTRRLYHWPGIVNTINLKHAINHYYQSHKTINPHAIVPLQSGINWDIAT